MKKIILSALLCLFINHSQAANVSCSSEDGQWRVDFQLEKDLITHLNFLKNGTLIKSVDAVQGTSTRILKREFFEFDLGGIKYFDFDRKVGAASFEAVFLLKNNPIAFDTSVYCQEQQ